jgi:hypothetical protein
MLKNDLKELGSIFKSLKKLKNISFKLFATPLKENE